MTGREAPTEQPPYPVGDVVGPCVCGSWPGGPCLRCEWIAKPASATPSDAHSKPAADAFWERWRKVGEQGHPADVAASIRATKDAP